MTETSAPRNSARDLGQIVIFAGLIAALTLIGSIQIGALPITLQTLGVLLAGAILGARKGTLAVLLYLAVGLVGVPVFAGGAAGGGALFGPTGGFGGPSAQGTYQSQPGYQNPYGGPTQPGTQNPYGGSTQNTTRQSSANDQYYYQEPAQPAAPQEPTEQAKEADEAAPAKFCPSCGTRLDADIKFCPSCGAKQ